MENTKRVLVFGSSGVGKTSLLNNVTGENHETSNLATGCTFQTEYYKPFLFRGNIFEFVDTVGLNEGSLGTFSNEVAINNLVKLIKSNEKGFNLLVMVIKCGRVYETAEYQYKLFIKELTNNLIPAILVVTCCENEDSLSAWGENRHNISALEKYSMKFKATVGTTFGMSKNKALESFLEPMRLRSKEMFLNAVESYSLSSPERLFENGLLRLIKKVLKYLANTLKILSSPELHNALDCNDFTEKEISNAGNSNSAFDYRPNQMDPVQLVNTGRSQTEIILFNDALKILKSETRGVIPIVIAGPTGKGKRRLMNCLMSYSSGIKFCSDNTEGFWIWIGNHPSETNQCLVLLYIEGFFEKENSNFDLMLLNFALFSSSMFIYTIPVFTGSSDKIFLPPPKSIGNHITKFFKEELEPKTHCSHFVWSIHDQTCELLKQKEKNEIGTEKSWKNSKKELKKNFMESMIYSYLKTDFFVFPEPAANTLYKKKILKLVSKKAQNKVFNECVSGESYATFLKNLAKKVNQNSYDSGHPRPQGMPGGRSETGQTGKKRYAEVDGDDGLAGQKGSGAEESNNPHVKDEKANCGPRKELRQTREKGFEDKQAKRGLKGERSDDGLQRMQSMQNMTEDVIYPAHNDTNGDYGNNGQPWQQGANTMHGNNGPKQNDAKVKKPKKPGSSGEIGLQGNIGHQEVIAVNDLNLTKSTCVSSKPDSVSCVPGFLQTCVIAIDEKARKEK